MSAGYRDLANPTIAAAGSQVYLAWDGQQIGVDPRFDDFGLMGVTSANGGDTWSTARHITENTNAGGGVGGGVQDPPKISRQPADAAPVQEGTLRPSLTLSGSGYALVWQQREIGGGGCSERGNATSEIHFAYTNTQWVTDVAANNADQYSIDPALVVAGTGTRHLVFMKDDKVTISAGLITGAYTLTPALSGYTFSPSSRLVTVPPDRTDQDFRGMYQASIYLPVIIKSN